MIDSSSPAHNQGMVLGSVTLGSITFPSVTQFVTDGSPDAGAYEAGGVQWIPGINRVENNGGTKSAALNKTINGTEDWKFEKISIYPNPASNAVNLGLPKDLQIYSLEIMDIHGRKLLVKDDLLDVSQLQIDVSGFKDGLYIIRTYSSLGNIDAHKILIQK